MLATLNTNNLGDNPMVYDIIYGKQNLNYKLFLDEPWFTMDFNTDSLVQDLLQSKHENSVLMFVQLLELCLEIMMQMSSHDQAQFQAKHDNLWEIVLQHFQEVEIEAFHMECMECMDDDYSCCSTEKEMDDNDTDEENI